MSAAEAPAAPVDGLPADGRVARRDRNKVAVLEAAIALFEEGHLEPDADDVAARCGLSPRSVYRYFEDRAGLLQAAIDYQVSRVMPLFEIADLGEGTLEHRIEALVSSRLALFEGAAAVGRAARLRALTSEVVAGQVELTRVALRNQVADQFAPELALMDLGRRRSVEAAIDALLELESIDHYRSHRGFSASRTASMLIEALRLLLGLA